MPYIGTECKLKRRQVELARRFSLTTVWLSRQVKTVIGAFDDVALNLGKRPLMGTRIENPMYAESRCLDYVS
jgi:hypothetical protein